MNGNYMYVVKPMPTPLGIIAIGVVAFLFQALVLFPALFLLGVALAA